MNEPKNKQLQHSNVSTQLDKETIYSKLGYNFTEQQQPADVMSVANSSGSYAATINRREVHNCKFAPSYKCNLHEGTLKLPNRATIVPVMPRNKKEYESGGEIVCFYYEPNEGPKSNVVVVNRAQPHETIKSEEGIREDHLADNKVNRKQVNKQVQKQHPPKQQREEKRHAMPIPSPSDVLEYKHRYKEFVANKRDKHYLALLIKIIEKLDFERYQCTSPNDERVHAQWKGKLKPRRFANMDGLVSYYNEFGEGLVELRKYLYLFLCQAEYDIKSPYEALAEMLVEGFRKYMQNKKERSAHPEKALNKLNFRKAHQKLSQKISKQALYELFSKLSFLPMMLRCSLHSFKSANLDDQRITYEQYEAILKHAEDHGPKPNHEELEESRKKLIDSHKLSSQNAQPHHPLFKTEEEIDRMAINVVPQNLLGEGSEQKKLTIREMRLLEDEQHRQVQQKKIMDYRFKAKSIPKAVRDKGVYRELLEKNQQRREANKEQSLRRTHTLQKPFSFYQRQQNKKKQTMDDFYHWNREFRARSVPKLSKQLMLDQMLERQQMDREQNLKARQERLLGESHYPRSMKNLANFKEEIGQKLQQSRRQLYGTLNSNQSYYRCPPHFGELHRREQESLERRKMNFTATKPVEFKLSTARPLNMTAAYLRPLTGFIEEQRQSSPKRGRYIAPALPKYVSASTLKFEAMVAKRRERQHKTDLTKLKEENEQFKRKQKQEIHKQELLSRLADNLPVNEDEMKSIGQPKEPWSQRKNALIDKVYEQEPLLIERHYVRRNGRKVQEIVQPEQPSDRFRTIL